MEKLVKRLNAAAKAYYSGHESSMSDKEYDALYDQLKKMEQESGVVLPDSPTLRVGYEVVSSLKKMEHERPALSLDKTKDVRELQEWLGYRAGILSWKLDGLTAVATWDDGHLTSLVTRGNGIIGEDVTHNAPYIAGLPQEIPDGGHIVVRGEVVISYSDFEQINGQISEPDDKYKNPRNLVSSSLRLLDSYVAKDRHMQFQAFELVTPSEETIHENFQWLEMMGIMHVQYLCVDHDSLEDVIEMFGKRIDNNSMDIPTDGLVLSYDDIAYGKSLGMTGKFPHHSIAFKWQDDAIPTTLRSVEWSASRTGLINPVAVFEPVELEGTTVKRASLHNLSYIANLELGIGDEITVYKANKIIPQVDENLTRSGELAIPETCPVCGGATERRMNSDQTAEFLYCTNSECIAKHAGKFTRLVERDALNIRGLSSSRMEQFVSLGFLKELSDIYHLDEYKEKLLELDGFGEKAYCNMINAIEDSRKTTFRQFFYALGIPGAGHDVAKILERYLVRLNASAPCTNVLATLMKSKVAYDTLVQMEGIGDVTAKSMIAWFSAHMNEYFALTRELSISYAEPKEDQPFVGMIFVITGKLETYPNRDALKEEIESRGGKVSGSVSKNTTYLINNDTTSTSGKNKKAQELGITIISEEMFKKL